MSTDDEARKALKACLDEALAFADHHELFLTGARISDAIMVLKLEPPPGGDPM